VNSFWNNSKSALALEGVGLLFKSEISFLAISLLLYLDFLLASPTYSLVEDFILEFIMVNARNPATFLTSKFSILPIKSNRL